MGMFAALGSLKNHVSETYPTLVCMYVNNCNIESTFWCELIVHNGQ